jgi:Fic family protein
MAPIQEAPSLAQLLEELQPERVGRVFVHANRPTVEGRYMHWDSVRHRTPPDGLTAREWWFALKLARRPLLRPMPLVDAAGAPFQLAMPDPALEMLHQIDQQAGGEIALAEEVTNPATRDRYLVSSLIEESITSSQLEGANTTRRVAKEMLRTGRPARTKDERMIANNFRAMNAVRSWLTEPMTVERVLDLHRIVTDGTLHNPDAAGRFQRPDEERVSVIDPDNNVVFSPPPADQLPERAKAMVAFANGEVQPEGFLHPVMRSVLLHFWLAHDHPFEDGNGRTARALFYWSMLRNGYWLAEFLSISRILRRAPMQYARSFIYTETDEQDVTYFALHQLGVILRSIEDLKRYLQRKMQEKREIEKVLRTSDLNHRQIAVISHALRHLDADYTFRSHQRSHGVVYQSARSDLLDLEERGLLVRSQVGKTFHFRPAGDLEERLSQPRQEPPAQLGMGLGAEAGVVGARPGRA